MKDRLRSIACFAIQLLVTMIFRLIVSSPELMYVAIKLIEKEYDIRYFKKEWVGIYEALSMTTNVTQLPQLLWSFGM